MKRLLCGVAACVMAYGTLAFPAMARSAVASPAAAPSSVNRQLDAVLAHGESRPLAALAAVRLHDGQVSYSYFGGFARQTGKGTQPVTADTLFRIASISKVVTTIGLLELVEQGKISLDRDVSDYLGFPVRNPDFPTVPITLRMLLDHTSTIIDADGYVIPPERKIAELFAPSRKPGDPGYHFAAGAGHPPGTWFAYCNLCYGLVGTIIEKVSGERFDRYQQAHVLTPLGIDGGYNPLELAHPERLATLYRHTATGFEAETDSVPLKGWSPERLAAYQPGTNGTLFSPQGGLRVSMNGLVRLARFMQQGGTLDGVRLLSPVTIQNMEIPGWRNNGHNGECPYPISAYGMSLVLLTGERDTSGRPDSPYPGYRGGLRGHLGDAYGLHSGFWYDPQSGDAFLFAADGFPEEARHGAYSSFTRVEEDIFTALSGVGQ